jgi:hypothetical protein
MMRGRVIAALTCSLGSLLVFQTPIRGQQADPAPLPVSLDRIRVALAKPTLLQVPDPSGETPMFRSEVREQLYILQPIEEVPFDPTYGLPSIGELIMGGVGKIRQAVVNRTRRRAERRAQKEVEDALAAFCAARSCSTAQ